MINLIINYYSDKDILRRNELISTLMKNLSNRFIEKIYILANDELPEKVFHLVGYDKIRVIKRKNIPTYEDYFDIANAVNNGHEISIISNLDIAFDETIAKLIDYDFNNNTECISLTRNDLRDSKRNDSQDCWIFKGFITEIPNCDFTMGIAGCDNAIAYCINEGGYKLRNPAHAINANHIHNAQVRNYIHGSDIKRIDSEKYPYLTIEIENSL